MRTPDLESVKTLDPTAVFSVGEAARMLGMTHNGVLGRIASGHIKAGRSGSRYFIPGKEIQNQVVMPGDNKKATAKEVLCTEL